MLIPLIVYLTYVWGPEQEEAFSKLNDKLTEPPLLAYANYQLPFVIHKDAPATGLCAVLYHRQGGIDRVIAYGIERNYPTHKPASLAQHVIGGWRVLRAMMFFIK